MSNQNLNDLTKLLTNLRADDTINAFFMQHQAMNEDYEGITELLERGLETGLIDKETFKFTSDEFARLFRKQMNKGRGPYIHKQNIAVQALLGTPMEFDDDEEEEEED